MPYTAITKEQVIEVLNTIIEKEKNKSIREMGLVTYLAVEDNSIKMVVTPGNPSCPVGLKLAYDAKVALLGIPGVKNVDVKITGHKHSEEMNRMLDEL